MFLLSIISAAGDYLAGKTQGARRRLAAVRMVFVAPID